MKFNFFNSIKTLVLLTVTFAHAQGFQEGAMIREGEWGGEVGSYSTGAFGNKKASTWPIDGWYLLTLENDHIQSKRVIAPKGKRPNFLISIAKQQIDPNEQSNTPSNTSPEKSSSEMTSKNEIYLRMQNTKIKEGKLLSYKFKNGTSQISPQLDYRYELTLGNQNFAFKVSNGYRNKSGVAYGDGAQYLIEYDGQKFEYSLGEFGWASRISAISDIDGDGKPDFIINVQGNNSGAEFILLSSHAKPGKNVPSASLFSQGC